MNKPRQAKTTNIDEQPKKKKRQTNQKNQTQKIETHNKQITIADSNPENTTLRLECRNN